VYLYKKYFLKTQEMQSYAFRTAKIFRRKIFLDQQCEIPSDDAAQNPNSQMRQKFWEPNFVILNHSGHELPKNMLTPRLRKF
jgi:hypothetical protein